MASFVKKDKKPNRKIPTTEETRKRINDEQAPIFEDLLGRCIDTISKTRHFPIQIDSKSANHDTQERVATNLRKAGWSVIIAQGFLTILLPEPNETPIDHLFELMKDLHNLKKPNGPKVDR